MGKKKMFLLAAAAFGAGVAVARALRGVAVEVTVSDDREDRRFAAEEEDIRRFIEAYRNRKLKPEAEL